MLYTIQMTEEEQLEMYLKLSKKELAKMLISANNIIDTMSRGAMTFPVYPSPVVPEFPGMPWDIYYTTSDQQPCKDDNITIPNNN